MQLYAYTHTVKSRERKRERERSRERGGREGKREVGPYNIHVNVCYMYSKITNVTSVVRCTKDEFRCSVVPRANVRHIRFTLYQNFSTAVSGERKRGRKKE